MKKLQSPSQSQTCIKKSSWSLVVCCQVWPTTTLWIPMEPLYLRTMLSKSLKCTENCNACSRHWSTVRAQFSMTQPTACHTTNALKAEWIGLRSSVSSTIFSWPLTNRLPLLQASQELFAEKMLPHFLQENARRQKMLSIKSQSMDFYATGINKLLYHWQKCVASTDSSFD